MLLLRIRGDLNVNSDGTDPIPDLKKIETTDSLRIISVNWRIEYSVGVAKNCFVTSLHGLKDGQVMTVKESKRTRGTHVLGSADGEACQDIMTQRYSSELTGY